MPGTSETAARQAGVLNADPHVPERGHLHGPVDGHRCSGNSGHEHRDRDGRHSPVLFQDTFSSSTPSSAWSFVGGTWQINNGTLDQTSTAAADPKKAMITNQTYPSNVMITAEVQVNSWNPGDLARAGVGLYTNTSTGQGYNLLFHGTNQVQFLDDGVVWGNSLRFQLAGWHVVLVPARGKQRDVAGQSVGGRDRGTAELDVPANGLDRPNGRSPGA